MDDPWLLRPATVDDIAALGPIERAGNAQFAAAGHPEMDTDSVVPDHHARSAVRDGRLIVAQVDGHVVGWTLVLRLGDELCLAQISVAPEYQGRGIGSALLDDVVAKARAGGEPSVVLNTQGDVAWNRPWYERRGFVVVPPDDWTPALREVTAYQTEDGLDWSTRVHMRKMIAAEG